MAARHIPQPSANPLDAYHRRVRPGIIRRRTLASATIAGIAAAAVLVALTTPPASPSPTALAVASNTIPSIQPDTAAAPTAAPTGPITTSAPIPAPASSPSPAVPSAQPTEQTNPYFIAITATGYQAQVDQCQWVRMDLGAIAPIVGAHTSCGGAIVLTMKPGQQVDLTGQGLTGQYIVTGSRNVHAGQNAAAATDGMVADVLLQTCYYTGDGSELLIALARQSEATR